LSLSVEQNVRIAAAAFFAAIAGMMVGFLGGFTVGAAIDGGFANIGQAFGDFFKALATGSGLADSLHGAIGGFALAGLILIGLAASAGTAYYHYTFFKNKPLPSAENDLLSEVKTNIDALSTKNTVEIK
jgi:hypothetical protein